LSLLQAVVADHEAASSRGNSEEKKADKSQNGEMDYKKVNKHLTSNNFEASSQSYDS
jgi:hypothetical protein